MENSQISSTDQVIRLQKQVKEKDGELNELYEGQTRLEIQMSQLEGQLATVRDELKTRNAELTKERTTGESTRKELMQLKEDFAEIEELLKIRGD